MAVPFDPTDPRNLTPQQRCDELTALLAIGMRRLLAVRAKTPLRDPAQIPQQSCQNSLELSAESRLHVPQS